MELTKNELLILNFLWSQTEPQGFSCILEYFNKTTNKDWKKQTMSTYLTRLLKMGLIKSDNSGSRLRYYSPITKEEYYQNYATDIIAESFDNSLSLFVSAFTGKNHISQKEKDDLLNYLKGL